ncbi:hypothetical protein MMPV_009772 [Pyropia vietnamensis]
MAAPSVEWATRMDAQMDSLDASIDGLQAELDRCIDATAAQDEAEMQAALEALAETCEEMASTLAAVGEELESAAESEEGDLTEWLNAATARRDAMESIVERIKGRVDECLEDLP